MILLDFWLKVIENAKSAKKNDVKKIPVRLIMS